MVNNVYSNLKEIKREALDENVPIMQDDTIDFITDFIADKRVKKILEVGTAVGYSAIMMALSSPLVTVVTIEKDKDRYIKALKNVKKMGLEDRIILIYNDALEVKLKEKFDLIIIDAAKSKNKEFFSHFESNLDVNGSIITDNLSFHGYVEKDLSEISSRNVRGLVRKIRAYIDMKIIYRTSKNKEASAILFGLKGFSIYDNVITLEEINSITSDIYLSIDKNLFDEDLESLEKVLSVIDNYDIKGIFFYDLAVLSISKRLNIKTKLIWNQNFLVTNYKTCNFYYNEGVSGALISSEITIDEIIDIAKNTKLELFVNIFGHQLMGVSKRALISNYFSYYGISNEKDLNYMIEKNEKFPVVENSICTRIYTKDVLNGIRYLKRLKDAGIKYLIIDDIFLESEVSQKIKDIFEKSILSCNDADLLKYESLIKDIIPNSGPLFLDKKTIYRVKKK